MSIRRREMATVLAHVRAGFSVELRGSWGSGRSALLRGIATAARDDGFDTLTVTGEFALRTHALGALDVAGVRPTPSVAGGTISARIDVLTERVLARPTVILVDDAAAVDPESWGVISAVQRRTDVSVVYALDAHAPQGSGAVHVLERRVAREVLEPLRYEEVRALLEDVLGGGVDAQTAGRVFSKSGGLPRLVVAVGRTGRQHGILTERAGAWHAGEDLWHPTLAPQVTEILYPLTARLREGLEILALAGIVAIESGVRLIGSPVLEQLEARGLITVFRNGARVMVAVNPPLIAEYFRHQPISARRVRLVERATSVADSHEEAVPAGMAGVAGVRRVAEPIPERPVALGWEAVRKPAVARLIVEHRQAEASRALAAWRAHPGQREAVAVVDACADDADAERLVIEVLGATRYVTGEPRESLALLAHRAILAVRGEGMTNAGAGASADVGAGARAGVGVGVGVGVGAEEPGGNGGQGPDGGAQEKGAAGESDAVRRLAVVMSDARAQVPELSDALDAIGLEAAIRARGFSPENERQVRDLIDRFDARGARSSCASAHVDEARVALAEVLQAKGWFERALRVLDVPAQPAERIEPAERGDRAQTAECPDRVEPSERPEPAGESAHWRRRRRRVTALALFGVGRIDEALRRSAEWRDAALADLDAEALRDQAYVCALALVHTGRNAEADDAIGAALALGEPGATSGDVSGGILVLGAIVAARRGAIDVAETLTAQARRCLRRASPLPLAATSFADAHRAHARGDDDGARRLLSDAHAEFTRRGFSVQAAIAEVIALESLPDEAAVPRSAALEGDLFGPLLEYLRGVGGAEAAWIELAGDRLRAVDQVVHAAGAYLRAADAYRLEGRSADADRVDRLAHALGGTLDADVLRHVHTQAAFRPALTQREREITFLAAAGTTNQTIATRLSVSVRTVENHLNRAFRKLGISRRDELEAVRSLWADPRPN